MFEHVDTERYCPCGARNPRAKAKYCRSCGAAASRRSYGNRSGVIAVRRRNRPLTAEEKRTRSARSYLAVYIKRGKAQVGPCETCGLEDGRRVPVQPNPERPLEVRWFCVTHYRAFRIREAEELAIASAEQAELAPANGWRIADPAQFATKREWFESQWPHLDVATQTALRRFASEKLGSIIGIALSEQSPMFRSALVSVFDRYSRGEVRLDTGPHGRG